jgi:uncharacterized Zn-binding protein involved in type VI secretion
MEEAGNAGNVRSRRQNRQGGEVEASGKRIARVGDKVACPKKGHGTTEIVTGDLTMVIDGKAVAYHGCKTSCGATLISSQLVTTVDARNRDGSGGRSAAASRAAGMQSNDEQPHLVTGCAPSGGLEEITSTFGTGPS